MEKDDFFLLGKITKFNKKTAELVIVADTDNAGDYLDNPVLFLDIDGGLVPFFVQELRLRGNDGFYALLEDFTNSEKAQTLIGCNVYLPVDKLAALDDNHFYYHDIVGFTVVDQQAGELGKIIQVFEGAEQVLLKVLFRGRELLIPLVDQFLVKVNKRKKVLIMDLPEGLTELNS
ncbi:MAG TPA: ribosome maturation factor RimM [Bacteroidales bacterium]|nr:ribosome maturation factor RimM [Bacteroidales bacterium]HRW96618.1 ribosome maturation factor RimM [Bacteroidales bacterium]